MTADDLAGLPRRVLLTGGSRGIGAAIADALVARGVRLALIARDPSPVRSRFSREQGHVVIEADLEQTALLSGCVEQAARGLGGLDGFVSCAGIVEYAPVGEIDAASLQRQAMVNWMAPLLLAQRVVPELEDAGGGVMLMVASTLGFKAAPLTAAYAGSKAALIASTRSLALELGARAIRVNALAPGVVDTEMVRVVRLGPGETRPDGAEAECRIEAQLAHLRALHPLGRLGTAAEIAESALFLLSAPYVTGAVVTVDGGLSLGVGDP